MVVVPFSVTPTTPSGGCTPGKASCAMAPPSSSTNHGVTPRDRSSSTAAGASGPETSSRAPKDSQTSRAGTKPSASRPSTAAQMPTSEPLSSSVPRPQTAPSWISAPKGGCCHGADSSIGHDVDVRHQHDRVGVAAPLQWKSSEWSRIPVRVRCSCSSGKSSASVLRNSSNGAGSMAASSA